MRNATEQEIFWKGEFGNNYIDRNRSSNGVVNNIVLFSKIMERTSNISSVIEFGSNIGQNLKAIQTLLPNVKCSAVEINHKAAEILRNDPFFEGKLEIYETSVLDFESKEKSDFVLTKGILIHN